MKQNRIIVMLLAIALLCVGCTQQSKNPSKTNVAKAEVKREMVVPTIQVYTLGNVSNKTRDAIMDSLRRIYPKCEFIKNVSLPASAITKKRHDHVRYRADLLNAYLEKYKTKDNIVVGLTHADIGLDDFRNRPHSGIRGLANGFGKGIATFSDYRGNSNELFRIMLHEIAHTLGLRHCKTEGCIMQDQKGGNKMKSSPDFCPSCKKFMIEHHFKLK